MVDAVVVQQLTMHAKNSITSRSAACAFSGAFGGSWVCLGFTVYLRPLRTFPPHRSTCSSFPFGFLLGVKAWYPFNGSQM
jgi:hypothetical protein